ncbi:hypothetical protein [Clostridium sporogenes]|nr:hypothetical protein [Clostridium sporogenes]
MNTQRLMDCCTLILKLHPMPKEDTMERIHISIQAQMVSDEFVVAKLICI